MQDPIYYFEPNQALSWRQARLEGPDARDFLHRITSVDVKNLAIGDGSPACILDAQGRFRAFFWLWCQGQNEFLFEIEAGPGDPYLNDFLAVMDQFTFAEKMKLTTLPASPCLWVFGSNQGPLNHGDQSFGRTWTTLWGATPKKDWKSVDLTQVENWRIESLSARPGHEIDTSSNPLELGLVQAVADQKGCYPGQEVIEKILALGAPARRLALVQLSGDRAPQGAEVTDAEKPGAAVGKLTSVGSTQDGGCLALALLRKTHAQVGAKIQTLDGNSQGVVLKVAPYAKA